MGVIPETPPTYILQLNVLFWYAIYSDMIFKSQIAIWYAGVCAYIRSSKDDTSQFEKDVYSLL